MSTLVERGAVPHFALGVTIVILCLLFGFWPLLSALKKPKKFHEKKWEKTSGKFLRTDDYTEQSDYRSGRPPIELYASYISYRVDEKEYKKYVEYDVDNYFNVYYRKSNPNIFMLEDEYKENVRISRHRRRRVKENLCVPMLIFTLFFAFMVSMAGINIIIEALDEHTVFDGHGGSITDYSYD